MTEIKIVANGETWKVPAQQLLTDFLASRNQSIERVIVERNGEALTPSEARSTLLEDGDTLEIVRIVAGG
jgi:thiamine biosynthesis protein ThiS